MHADELRMAVTKVVSLLNKSQIRIAVDRFRSAKGEERKAAAARLGHAGAMIMEQFEGLTENEAAVVRCLHLESLGSTDYWTGLLEKSQDPRQQQAEIIRLASRVVFAGSHLPALMALLRQVEEPEPAAGTIDSMPVLKAGEGSLYIRLTDAGEKASDPDRIARAIDGVDMIYSACAAIARKPAMDIRLDALLAKRNNDRDLRFTGESDSVSAVTAVIDSIPDALTAIESDQDVDLNAVVASLPIFKDLNTLASLGTFSAKDIKDISETMSQGALLTLESGVILVDEEMVLGEMAPGQPGELSLTMAPDRHYQRYIDERDAIRNSTGVSAGAAGISVSSEAGSLRIGGEQNEEVDNLLRSLGESRQP